MTKSISEASQGLTARQQKAARLVAADRVQPVKARTFIVDGESGTYLVTLLEQEHASNVSRWSCTCVFGRTAPIEKGECAHVLGARAFVALEHRKAAAS